MRVKISLITPAKKQARSGNMSTALRWAGFLRGIGHHVKININYNGENTDLMIAIHAWRSADAILRYREKYPKRPLIVCLGGTDINTFLKTDPEKTILSMKMANALICLHDLIGEELPVFLKNKLHLVRQSASPLPCPRRPAYHNFDVCVIGHLRDEKDPFRTALAARLMPVTSKIRVIHLGKAHTAVFASQANNEMVRNSRYRWIGDVPRWRVRRELIKTRLMVISSIQEGGANVISEAIVAGVPIIASNIPGNIGLLGYNYDGYYPVSNEHKLAELLVKAESDQKFINTLEKQLQKIKPLFGTAQEEAALCRIVNLVSN
jgi:putative glycosyltransferase (TIGR04348 family)